MAYDYIVIGSGSAGAVVARRLIDGTDASVLLIEAGGPDVNPAISDPARVHELWHSADDWAYATVPQPHAAGRSIDWPRGRVLGGTSSFHGMIYVRGWRGDFDRWAYDGNAGWGYDDVLPLFKRSEDFDGTPSAYRGVGGPMRVTANYVPHVIAQASVDAMVELGLPLNPDYNGADIEGAALAQFMIRDGRRESSATAFLRAVIDHPRLTVSTETTARRLVFRGTQCVGVEVDVAGQREVLEANIEVVVSAGAIESPKLLMLSGIGDSAQLSALGITPLVHLPGVGQNLHDHVLVPMIFGINQPLPPNNPGQTPHQAQFFAHSRSGLPGPDLQPLIFNVPLASELPEMPADAFTILPGLVRPASRGQLTLASADPSRPPILDPAYLTQDADVTALEVALEMCREMAAQPALQQLGATELTPGPKAKSSAEVRDFVRRNAGSYFHPVGTCKMGIDAMAVVDPELRVYGTTGLRVADASIMPAVTSGNTHAPTMMIGERCADLLIGR